MTELPVGVFLVGSGDLAVLEIHIHRFTDVDKAQTFADDPDLGHIPVTRRVTLKRVLEDLVKRL